MKRRHLASRAGIIRAAVALAAAALLLSQVTGCSPYSKAPPREQNPASTHGTTASPPPAPPDHRHIAARNPASVPPDDEQTLDQAIANLKQGNLAYSTPTKMKTGQTTHVVARIGSDKVSIDTLKNGMPSDQGSQTYTAQTPVSTKMKMTLTSADFDITSLSSEEQFVTGDTPTMWEWQITPKHSGTLSLHLAAVVELNNLSRDFTTVDRNISVQVDPIDAAEGFFKANTVWVLGVLGAAIASMWAWFKKRKTPSPAPTP